MFGKRRSDKCHLYRFQKSIEKVPHQLLLQKLKLYKVDPSIINWIKSFLCFRKQRVRLNGFFSEWTEVISGIPQGTVTVESSENGAIAVPRVNICLICRIYLHLVECLLLHDCLVVGLGLVLI